MNYIFFRIEILKEHNVAFIYYCQRNATKLILCLYANVITYRYKICDYSFSYQYMLFNKLRLVPL